MDAAKQRADCSAIEEFKIGLHLLISDERDCSSDSNHKHGDAVVSKFIGMARYRYGSIATMRPHNLSSP